MIDCEREPEILDAVWSGYWPEDLRQHAGRCAVCEDLAAIAGGLRDEREDAMAEARVPTAGQVWWRATMRRRAEASTVAARPITVLQGIAGACAAGAAAAAMTVVSWSTSNPFAWLASMLQTGGGVEAAALPAAATQPAILSLAVIVGAGILVAPLLLYLALSEE
jgi:hypothetical protein